MRNPSKDLQRKCGTKEFLRFENEFLHFKNEFSCFEIEFGDFEKELGYKGLNNPILTILSHILTQVLYSNILF